MGIGIGFICIVFMAAAFLYGKKVGSTTTTVKNKDRRFGASNKYKKIVIDGKRCLFLNEIDGAHDRYLKNKEDW